MIKITLNDDSTYEVLNGEEMSYDQGGIAIYDKGRNDRGFFNLPAKVFFSYSYVRVVNEIKDQATVDANAKLINDIITYTLKTYDVKVKDGDNLQG